MPRCACGGVLRELLPQYRFHRQHPIGCFVVDFACPRWKLAIEIDGGQHAIDKTRDRLRTAELARSGYRVVRFWNHDVLTNTNGVVEAIWRELENRRV
jgi:very-short-patch-repair endonuclease